MDYRATLNLPQTKFKMKANLAQNEPVITSYSIHYTELYEIGIVRIDSKYGAGACRSMMNVVLSRAETPSSVTGSRPRATASAFRTG